MTRKCDHMKSNSHSAISVLALIVASAVAIVAAGCSNSSGGRVTISPATPIQSTATAPPITEASALQNGQWAQVLVGGEESTHFGTISCPTSSFCMAVGSDMTKYNGTRWSNPIAMAAAPNYIDVDAVSCSSSAFCAAINGGYAYTFNGSSWATPVLIDSADADSEGVSPESFAISCTSPRFCLALEAPDSKLIIFDGSSWVPAPSSPRMSVTSISCVSRVFCLAIGSGLLSVEVSAIFNGVRWSAPAAIPADSGPVSVSCVNRDFCVAVGGFETGAAWVFNGSRWTATPTFGDSPNIEVDSVSCGGLKFCVAVASSA